MVGKAPAGRKPVTLKNFVLAQAQRPDSVGTAARLMLDRPPPRYSAKAIRLWAYLHHAHMVEELLAEFEEASRP